MLKLVRIEQPEACAVEGLFLDRSQTLFWEDGSRHDRKSAAEMLSKYFSFPSHHWIMYWITDVAGYGHVLRSDFLGEWIVSYIVHPKFQQRGIATGFVNEAKSFAMAAGIGRLYASVHRENIASIRVVEKSGFEITEEGSSPEYRLYRWEPQSRS